MTESEAVARLRTMCAPSSWPTISDPLLTQFVQDAAAPSRWAAGTAYTYGQYVKTSTGRVQRCIVAGTSGATEPTWPSQIGTAYRHTLRGQQTEDTLADGELRWEDVGEAPAADYDLRAAARLAWEYKASESAGTPDSADRDVKIQASQVHENCLRQARRYAPLSVA
jgi:hypothetical protein